MRSFPAITLAIVLGAAPALAQSPCGASSDCAEGLRCVKNACVDEATYKASLKAPGEMTGPGEENVQPFIGAAVGAALPAVVNTTGVGFQFSLRAGIFVKRFQLQVEASPMATAVLGVSPDALVLFDAVASCGYLLRLSDMVSWVF